MAPSNRHRRLMEDSTNTAHRNQFCIFQCVPEHNPTGVCFPFCVTTCPYFCHITDNPAQPSSSPSPANSPYSQTTPLALDPRKLSFPLKLSLIFLVATFIYTLYKFYTVWCRSRRHLTPPPSPENQETVYDDALDHHIWNIRTAGLQLSVINAITVVKFKKGDGVFVGTDCSICLTEFEADETLRVLPNCKHAFHISCVDLWLRSHTNCPLCRAGIVDNTVDQPSPEQNTDDSGFTGETDSRIADVEDDDREEASESSELTIGSLSMEYFATSAHHRGSVSMEDFTAFDHRGIHFQSVDGSLGIELVKMAQRTDNNFPKIGG